MACPSLANRLASSFFAQPLAVLGAAALLRAILLIYGAHQDRVSAFKYTDVDYLVFTDAARFAAQGRSPYARATYRYTPLLAWLLRPTAWTSTASSSSSWWFESGKALFAAADLLAGWLIARILVRDRGMSPARAMKYASLWLLNPMVANISTRGSSEGLVAVVVVALVWAVVGRRVRLAGLLLGLGVHLKIYPFIYAASIWWWLGGREADVTGGKRGVWTKLTAFVTRERWELAQFAFASFMGLNVLMYSFYGMPFVEHSYTYHLTRIDHRHNFSVYNTALHLSSLQFQPAWVRVESLAFVPQIFLSLGAIPYLLAKKDLASTMLAQTFAFVTFNKVCTSQYFLWYMVFLPFYLPGSSLLRRPALGITALALWVAGQALWLQQGYELEFLGRSTFVPGLWLASLLFFASNCWILGIVIQDIRSAPALASRQSEKSGKVQ